LAITCRFLLITYREKFVGRGALQNPLGRPQDRHRKVFFPRRRGSRDRKNASVVIL